MSDEPANPEPPDPADRILVLGKISGTFGVHGWIKVSSYTEPIENILDYEVWQIGHPGKHVPIQLEDGRVTGKGVLAKLTGIETPEDARQKVGFEIAVWRSELPPAEPGEYYLSDLEGMQALSPEGEVLGTVDHFRSTPSGTVVVIRAEPGHREREHWVPFVKDRIVKVELDARRIVLDWSLDW